MDEEIKNILEKYHITDSATLQSIIEYAVEYTPMINVLIKYRILSPEILEGLIMYTYNEHRQKEINELINDETISKEVV